MGEDQITTGTTCGLLWSGIKQMAIACAYEREMRRHWFYIRNVRLKTVFLFYGIKWSDKLS